MDTIVQTYDMINTTATRWLAWNKKEWKNELGIYDFDVNDKSHLWLLHIFEIYGYYLDTNYYLSCDIFTYIKLRYFKKFKRLRRNKLSIKTFDISAPQFLKDIYYNLNTSKETIEKIYNLYWEKK